MNNPGMLPNPLLDDNLEAQPLLLSVPQAAHLLGLGATFTWDLVRRGDLPSVRLGRRVLVPRRAIERLAERQSKAAGPALDDAPHAGAR